MNHIDQLCINTIRILSAEAVQKANSGHPGLPLGAAPIAYTLWSRHLKHNPQDPKWINRDRFILSAGHGSMLLYSLLHLLGYGLTIDDLKSFRQWGSKTPGHPEFGHTIGVEVTTGPLGQGVANGVGMAIAEAHLGTKFNKDGAAIIDHHTYVLAGDGCMMEGVASEAASLAGTLGLGKLIVLYDSNNITIEGNTDITFREDVAKRFEAYQWQVLRVEDGNDIEAIDRAISAARAETSRPSLIVINTLIGYGCPQKQGKASCHGEPLGQENVTATKENLVWPSEEEFHVPEEVKRHMQSLKVQGTEEQVKWEGVLDAYTRQYPELADEFEKWLSTGLHCDLLNNEEFWTTDSKANATRSSSSEVLNRLSTLIPNLIGGSADLAPSTKTLMNNRGNFSAENYAGSNLHFGVREHAMAAIANGMLLHGGLRAYVSTFFVFSDYMKPAMRLSALMGLPVIYVLTHDSIGVGEDGPTHQPVEHLAALRSIPNFTVFRPADAKETAAGWYAALTRTGSPTALVLTRQNLPQLNETGELALKGGYILLGSTDENPDVIIMASGSETHLAYEAGKVLLGKGIKARVVSMPSWEIFEEQAQEYKDSVLPGNIRKRLAVEAGSSFGWHRYVGMDGDILSIDHFGASAPTNVLFKEFGFTVDNIVNRCLELLKH